MSGAARRAGGDGRERRFRVDGVVLEAEGEIDPGASVHHHLRVLRAAPGDVVYLFDGRGGEVRAEVIAIDDAGARLRIIERVSRDVESGLDTCLVQAVPVRSARMETIVRQVTELGAHRIVPVLAEHSPRAKAKPAAWRRKAERWRRIAGAAAEQSGRTRVPDIDDPRPFADLDWDGLPRPLFIAEPRADVEGEGSDAPRLSGDDDRGGGATVMVGPEGGWADAEIEAARSHGATVLQLGPRVLRADSAGVVAMTLLQYLRGDLGSAADRS